MRVMFNYMCLVLTKTSPSLTLLALRHSFTSGVILMNARRVGTSNHSSLR